MKKIVAISGKKRHGKDSAASFILNSVDSAVRIAFADSLKTLVAAWLGISVEELENFKNNENIKLFVSGNRWIAVNDPDGKMKILAHGTFCTEKEIDAVGLELTTLEERVFSEIVKKLPTVMARIAKKGECVSFRQVLQYAGTEVVKETFGKDIWGKIVARKLEKMNANIFVIPDWRFPDEIEPLKDLGLETISVRVERVGVELPNDEHISEKALDDYSFDIKISAKSLDELKSQVLEKVVPLVCSNDINEQIANQKKQDVKQDIPPFIIKEKKAPEVFIMRWDGRMINPFDIKREDMENVHVQMAVTLPRIKRFFGQTYVPYSVAQHCLSMERLFEDHELKKWALAHEVFESFGIGDIPSPLKKVFPEIVEAENRALELFADIYGLPYPIPKKVKEADIGLMVMEATILMPSTDGYNWKSLGDPMGSLYKIGASEDEIRMDFLSTWGRVFG